MCAEVEKGCQGAQPWLERRWGCPFLVAQQSLPAEQACAQNRLWLGRQKHYESIIYVLGFLAGSAVGTAREDMDGAGDWQ